MIYSYYILLYILTFTTPYSSSATKIPPLARWRWSLPSRIVSTSLRRKPCICTWAVLLRVRQVPERRRVPRRGLEGNELVGWLVDWLVGWFVFFSNIFMSFQLVALGPMFFGGSPLRSDAAGKTFFCLFWVSGSSWGWPCEVLVSRSVMLNQCRDMAVGQDHQNHFYPLEHPMLAS